MGSQTPRREYALKREGGLSGRPLIANDLAHNRQDDLRYCTMTTLALPPASPPLETVSEWLDDLTELARSQGDVARMRRGWLLSHPDAVRDLLVTCDRCFTKSPALRRARFTLGQGLLTNEAESYRRQRLLIQP